MAATLAASRTDSLERLLSSAKGAERLEVLLKLGEEISETNPGQSLTYAEEAAGLSKKLKLAMKTALALKLMADSYYYQDNFQTAIHYYNESATIAKNSEGVESAFYIKRVGDVGYCYQMMDQNALALPCYLDALELARKTGLSEEIATNLNNLGYIYTEWGEYGLAVNCFEEAMDTDREAGIAEFRSTGLNNIGKVYELWGRPEEAIRYYTEALAIDRQSGNQAKIAVRLNNIAAVYRSKRAYADALDYFRQAYAIERQLGDNARVARRQIYIGETFLDMKQYDSALHYFSVAGPQLQGMGLRNDLARLYFGLGKYYSEMGRYGEARSMFDSSLGLAASNGLKPLVMSNYLALSEAAGKTGDYQTAMKHYQNYVLMKDSVFNDESSRKLAAFRARYENEKIRHENEMLRADSILKKQRNLVIFSLLALALIVSVATILYLRFRARSHRQQKQIALQQTENLRKDLELKNNELTYNAMCIIRTNESVAQVADTIRQMLQKDNSPDHLEEILSSLKAMKNEQAWKEFEVRFTSVHNDFYERLQEKFPDLTPNEKKLCAFLRLNMTTKDISAITHQSVHSINVARTRLRKKMNLANSEENLVNYLMSL
jgi:tetratricopeptide (TPR) repeat protein/DNA-binding CsgD family transcriptional regulator